MRQAAILQKLTVIGGATPTRYTCGVDTLFTLPPVEGVTVESIKYMRINPQFADYEPVSLAKKIHDN